MASKDAMSRLLVLARKSAEPVTALDDALLSLAGVRLGGKISEVIAAALAKKKLATEESGEFLAQGAKGFTELSSQARRYLKDLEAQTGFKVTDEQRANLANILREQEFTKLSPELSDINRKQFNKVKNDLISQWEANTGQMWPRYTEDVLAKNGLTVSRKAGQPFDAHHIIENSFGGPNEWWNMHPARFPDQHQGGIHRAGSVAREIFSDKK
ncbi:hypothetical protein Q1J68_00235 [Pseudomonas pergaminensis]|uniref:HNH endonuclease signature motif containing protein n=1 Tax=Pseudomonas pergaminensis TaxID=2853159 RepID=UPI0034D777F9